jgi:hypothetical protein
MARIALILRNRGLFKVVNIVNMDAFVLTQLLMHPDNGHAGTPVIAGSIRFCLSQTNF